MNLKGIYTEDVRFLLKFTLPYMVIAIIFALLRWDDSISHSYVGHTFALRDWRLYLQIEFIADWLKHGKTVTISCRQFKYCGISELIF